MTASLFAGIDLHSNNLTIGIVDQNGQRLKHQKLDCDLEQVTQFLEPFKSRFKSLAVESTYNWYWLVDGLRAQLSSDKNSDIALASKNAIMKIQRSTEGHQ